MTMIWMCGFESGSYLGDIVNSNPSNLYVSSTRKKHGTYSWYADSNGWWTVYLPVARSELYLQFYYNINDRHSTYDHLVLALYGNNNNMLGKIECETAAMNLRLYNGSSSLVDTGSAVLALNTWYLIEWHLKVADADGVSTVRLDGAEELSYTGDTKPSTDTTIYYLHGNAGGSISSHFFDSFVVNDTNGSKNNTWPGGVIILGSSPTAAGSRTECTASTGDNYTCVDEKPPSTTDYVYTNTNGVGDLYAMGDVTASAGTILGVMERVYGFRAGPTDVSGVKQLLKVGGTEYEASAASPIGYSHLGTYNLWENNPATSATWVASAVNAMEAGFEAVT